MIGETEHCLHNSEGKSEGKSNELKLAAFDIHFKVP